MVRAARRFTTAARFLVSVSLLAAMLVCAVRLPAQEIDHRQGVIKGTVSLVNPSNESKEGSTTEGLVLELKPLAEGSPSLTAVTDAAGNYEFKDVPDGDYFLQLLRDGFEPFSATLHVQGGASIVQNISVKLSGITEKVEVKEQADPLSTTSSTTPKFDEKQLESLPLAEENFKQALPLTPGVVRTPDGKLTVRGSAEESVDAPGE